MRLIWILLAVMAVGLTLLIVNDEAGTTFGLDNDDFGQTLVLGLWGALLASGIVASGMRFGEVSRNLALWLAVVVVLVAGYQYRYELQDVASRVSAGLVPGSPLSIGEEDGRATITLEKMRDGHFGATISVAGTAIRAVVDTGATTTVLTFADALRAGLNPEGLAFNIPVSTANGTANAALARPAELSLGPIVRRDLPILVAEQRALGQSLLGMNFLGTLSGIDVRGDRMILRD